MKRRFLGLIGLVFMCTALSAQEVKVEQQETKVEQQEIKVEQQETKVEQQEKKEEHQDTKVEQKEKKAVLKKDKLDWNERVMQAFTDSIDSIRASYFERQRMWEDANFPTPKRMRFNPYAYRMFAPPTFYLSVVEQVFTIDWKTDYYQNMNAVDSLCIVLPYYSKPGLMTKVEMGEAEKTDRWVNNLLMNFYLKHPELVMGNELYFTDLKVLDESQITEIPGRDRVKEYMKVQDPLEKANASGELIIVKPNFWKYKGTGKMQFTQHSVSDNWYKGGESTNALYSELILSANYDDKHRVEFENLMEIKLGFITAPSDTVHSYKTNADKFRLYSKLGVKAFGNFFYTLTGELNTQFFPNYNTNSNNLVSNFLSPFELKFTLGMDYKFSKNNFNLSVLGSPFTYKYVYLKDDDLVNPSAFEVKAGDHHADLFGSQLTANWNWQIRPNIKWNAKLEYFTTYDKVTVSWENTFEFTVNRYMSANIFLHPRFDDGVTLSDDNKTYFQFKEMLTFGLAYEW